MNSILDSKQGDILGDLLLKFFHSGHLCLHERGVGTRNELFLSVLLNLSDHENHNSNQHQSNHQHDNNKCHLHPRGGGRGSRRARGGDGNLVCAVLPPSPFIAETMGGFRGGIVWTLPMPVTQPVGGYQTLLGTPLDGGHLDVVLAYVWLLGIFDDVGGFVSTHHINRQSPFYISWMTHVVRTSDIF